MKKLMERSGDRIRGLARKLCGRISPDRRIAVIVTAFCLFAVVNILVVASAIRNIGRDNSRFERMMLPENRIPASELLPEGEGEGGRDSLGLELQRFLNDNFNLVGEQSYDTTNE